MPVKDDESQQFRWIQTSDIDRSAGECISRNRVNGEDCCSKTSEKRPLFLVGGFNPTPLKNDGVRQLA